ncbi:MAG: shikimate dehydrogenase [Buchnera aphidicola (Floraphis choui)]
MLRNHLSKFSVFGNPIDHTKSPLIHRLFSEQTNIVCDYNYTLVPIRKFYEFITNFFLCNGIGANVTSPFKEEAFLIADELTDYARASESVNTLKKLKNGKILGDNTDGKGILYDLKRLKFLKRHDNILVIGAGGAARGIIFSLLSYGCNIVILNRTKNRATKLVSSFKKFGSISVLSDLKFKNNIFDLVINAIANVKTNNYWNFISHLINRHTNFYDINYSSDTFTPFLSWCINHNIAKFSDGIGMLVSQAAYSFYLWHNVFPEIESVIVKLRRS